MTVYETDRVIMTAGPESDTKPMRLLMIDDEETQTLIFSRMLTSEYPGAFQITGALTLSAGLELLEQESFDCVLLDHRLPDGFGVMSIDRIQALADTIPIIILTGMRDSELEFAALAGGAQDYLAKDDVNASSIRRAVLYAIERARLQNGLMNAQADQLSVQKEFFSHVSHELRTPVAAMYLSATNLGDGLLGKVSPDQREAVEVIADNVQQLRRLVDDLLDATRMTEGKVPVDLTRVDLGPLASAAARRHQNRGGMVNTTAHVEIEDGVSAVLADRQRVIQILDNLFSNAAKYAPGTPVTIRLASDPSSAGSVIVSVEDRGPGIAEEDFDRIFERMTQLEGPEYHTRRGLGLGLYISRDLATRMEGELWVGATEGGGATFHLSLPAHPLDLLLRPHLEVRRSKAPVELTKVDIDVFAGHAVLAGTELAHELMDHVEQTLGEVTPRLAVVRLSDSVLRCLAIGSDAVGASDGIAAQLEHAGTLGDAGITPTISKGVVRATKARRRSIDERVDEMAELALG